MSSISEGRLIESSLIYTMIDDNSRIADLYISGSFLVDFVSLLCTVCLFYIISLNNTVVLYTSYKTPFR